jgi:hypothetical protein
MNGNWRRLGAMHRVLWYRDWRYRIGLLVGLAPLFGGAVAAGAWFAARSLGVGPGSAPPPVWATPVDKGAAENPSAQPRIVAPAAPLPAITADGRFPGYAKGWQVVTDPITVSATFDVDVEVNPLTGFTLDGSSIDMARIMAEARQAPLFVAVGTGQLVVREAGTYTVSARLDRPAGPRADCLVRVGFGPDRIISNLRLGLVNDTAYDFEPARFELQPGLYSIGWAFGCWQGQAMLGPGRFTLLIGHPGEAAPAPARDGDVVRAESAKP